MTRVGHGFWRLFLTASYLVFLAPLAGRAEGGSVLQLSGVDPCESKFIVDQMILSGSLVFGSELNKHEILMGSIADLPEAMGYAGYSAADTKLASRFVEKIMEQAVVQGARGENSMLRRAVFELERAAKDPAQLTLCMLSGCSRFYRSGDAAGPEATFHPATAIDVVNFREKPAATGHPDAPETLTERMRLVPVLWIASHPRIYSGRGPKYQAFDLVDTLFHELTHFADVRLLETWIEREQKLPVASQSKYFKKYVRVNGERVEIDSEFYVTFLETRGYRAHYELAELLLTKEIQKKLNPKRLMTKVAMYHLGKSAPNVMKELGITSSTVFDLALEFERTIGAARPVTDPRAN